MENLDNDDLLWSYLDGNLSQEKQREIAELIAGDVKLKSRFEELKRIDEYTKANMLKSPSASFTSAVMAHVQQVKISYKNSDWIFLVLVLTTVILGGYYISQNTTSIPIALQIDSLPALNKYLPIGEISIDKKFDIDLLTKGLLYVMSFLSLLLFDKAFLKPFFRNRRLSH